MIVVLGSSAALVVALALLVLVYASGQAGQPRRVAGRYCASLVARNYAAAYALLAPSARAQQSAAQFTSTAQLQDTVDGHVTGCSIDGDIAPWGNLGFVLAAPNWVDEPLTISRARLGARSGSIGVVRQADGWRVAGLSSALQGTNLGPLLVANHFCAALAAGDYKGAYGDLSAHQMSIEKSATSFAGQAQTPGGASYAGCAPDYKSYRITDTTATLTLMVNIRVNMAGKSVVEPAASMATFVEEHGVWKLDGLDVSTPAK